MAHDYLPRRGGAALLWMKAFAGGIAEQPSAFMLSPADGAALLAAVEAYGAALAVATEPGTRTPGAVNRKDTARNAAEQICRQYYSIIKPNGGVSDAMKIAIGMRPVNLGRQRIACPQSAPLLNIVAAMHGEQTLFYRDSLTPDSRAKPFGALQLQLMVRIGDAPGSSPSLEETPSCHFRGCGAGPEGAKLVGQFTRNPVTVPFEHGDDRKKATYYGRWVSSRGEVGPWSLPVSMSIVA